jgi:DNA-binding NarL/FixJ family response regulator
MTKSLHSPRQTVYAVGRERNLTLVGPANAQNHGAPAPIRVLVAHGDRLARAGLAALLDAEPDVAVAGAAADGMQAIALARELRPDVLLIDIAVPGIDAGTVTQRILADVDSSSVRVVVLGPSNDDETILSSLRAGASGFLVNDAEPAELARAVRAVAAGEAALSPSGVRLVITELAAQPDPLRGNPELLEELTAREIEVMALVAGGLSNGQIAQQLVVTQATAKTHVSRVMTKLRARHRAQLVTLAYETGLVRPRASGGTADGVAAEPSAVA